MTFLIPRELAEHYPELPPVDEPLFVAACTGDVAGLRARLEAGVPPDHPAGDLSRMTPLLYAILGGHHDCMRLLLEAGADVHLLDGVKGRSPLRAALQRNDEAAVKILLEFNADPGFYSVGERPNGTRYDGAVTDEQIAQQDCTPAIAEMVSAARHKFKVTELAHDNTADIAEVRRLLEAGVPPDIKNENGQTALMYACIHRNFEMVQALLDYNADTEITWKQGGATALRLACGGHMKPVDPRIVKLLLDHGANPHTQDARGRSMMHSAASGGSADIMMMVAEKGVPLAAKDAEGNTPDYAAQEWDRKGAEAATLLEQVGEDLCRRETTVSKPLKPLKPLRFGPKA